MQTSESIHSGGYKFCQSSLKWQPTTMDTYGAAIQHTACNVLLGRELEAFSLQISVDLIDVYQIAPALCSDCPRLDETQHPPLHFLVRRNGSMSFQQRCKVVHELARGNLGDEVCASVLYAGIGELVWR